MGTEQSVTVPVQGRQGAGACDQLSGLTRPGGVRVARSSAVCGPLDIYPLLEDPFPHQRREEAI